MMIEHRPDRAVADRAPARLPLLGRGRHARPEVGACLMGYVSVLAGERFSDAPACTHPALAALARLVNDRVGGEGARSCLALLAPDLIGTNRSDLRVTDTVVVRCLTAAAASGELPLAARRRLERARARLGQPPPSGRGGRWALWVREALRPPVNDVRWAFRIVHERWCLRPEFERDRGLRDLLTAAVDDCRRPDAGRTPTLAPSG